MSSCKASEIPRNEAYIEVRRNDLPSQIGFAVSRSENLTGRGTRVTQPFDASTLLSIDRESFDFAQDRELVERLVERLVEWQMGVFRRPHLWSWVVLLMDLLQSFPGDVRINLGR